MSAATLDLTDGLALADLRRAVEHDVRVAISTDQHARLAASRAVIDDVIARHDVVYGINTGFGLLANTRIDDDKLRLLQRNLVLSHAAGVGAPLSDRVVRLIMVLKIASLCRGHSGVRPEVVEALQRLLEHGIYPRIPAKGSVGASGDLAPLAHLAAALTGIGDVRVGGRTLPADRALDDAGLAPLTLEAKEGLALLNGTQVSTALALDALFALENVFAAALVGGAMCTDALKGSDAPFDARIHEARGHRGQIDCAAVLRDLLAGSNIRESHRDCSRVQDPYSLRCQPQVMGACLDNLRHAASVLAIEANAATDNPLVFADAGDVLSGGNFHAEPVAQAADLLAVVCAEVGAIAERRIALLIDPKMSGLPPFLVNDSGVNSGFMIAQVTAAALVSENKTLAHPASVDSIPTSANQEDHVSMATFAARRLGEMCDNTANVIAIELLAAAQGIGFHRPQQSSAPIERALAMVREQVPPLAQDRYIAPDIDAVCRLVCDGRFLAFAGDVLPSASR